jgi:hypothetical protein
MVGKLNYELPIDRSVWFCRQNCAIASKFNHFLPYYFVSFRRFFEGAEQIRSSC